MATEVDVVIATLRAFAAHSGALRAVVLLDRGTGATPVLVDTVPGEPTELTEGETRTTVPEDSGADVAPLAVPEVKSSPPMEVDAEAGEIAAPLGTVAYLARAVRELSGAFGGRSVLTVQFATSDDEAPLAIAARSGEPLVLALGTRQFPMPADWP
ncbi:MAG TPA: hypothetical protein VK279_00665 [Solirubrobacteraceae bacterium]|nr:hypothetical protein [Solirubrobacteraceae bacterium]